MPTYACMYTLNAGSGNAHTHTLTQGGCVYEPSLGDQYARVEAVTSLRPHGASQGGGADGVTTSTRPRTEFPRPLSFLVPRGRPWVVTRPPERRRRHRRPSTCHGRLSPPRQAPAPGPRCRTEATMEASVEEELARDRVGILALPSPPA